MILSYFFWLVILPQQQWKTFVRSRAKGVASKRAVIQQEARSKVGFETILVKGSREKTSLRLVLKIKNKKSHALSVLKLT